MQSKQPALTLTHLIKDVYIYLGWRLPALIVVNTVCALSDSLRILSAFLLFPFLGITPDPELLEKAKEYFSEVGVPYDMASVSLLVISVFLIQGGISVIQIWYQGSYANYYTLKWRQKIFMALLRAKWQFFIETPRGKINNAISQETWRLQLAVANLFLFFSTLLVVLAYIGAALWISPIATVLMSLAGSIVFVLNALLVRRIVERSRKMVKGNEEMMTLSGELLNNIKILKASARSSRMQGTFHDSLYKIFYNGRWSYFLPNLTKVSSEILVILAVIAALLALSILGKDIEQHALLMVLILFMRAYSKVTMMLVSFQQMNMNLPSFEAVQNILNDADEMAEIEEIGGKQLSIDNLVNGICFKNVSVLYHDKYALKNINLVIPAGKMVAIVGPSGAGKTTFADTLLRLNGADSGQILVGDTRSEEFDLKSWRSAIGYISQETTLFHGSIADNIRLLVPDASNKDVIQAAKLAQAHDFIMNTTGGYQSQVGEHGLKLSGGQRQRIALARVLLCNPQVLILDEATSALDTTSEEKVMEAIYGLEGSKTIVIIAHRLSTVRNAEQIYVLNDGQLVECGNWDELIAKDGLFKKLWLRQAR